MSINASIPDLNTAIANFAETCFARRVKHEQDARSILAELNTAYGQTPLTGEGIKARAAVELQRAKILAAHESAARSDGWLVRMMTGDPILDHLYSSPEWAELYAAAERFNRVRWMKPAEAEDEYLSDYQSPVAIPK